MKTTQFKGVIDYDDTTTTTMLTLYNEDKIIDLVSEFESFDGKEIQVNYWITDEPCTKDEMLEGYLKKLFGAVDAEYKDYYTGSWTYGNTSWIESDREGVLKIGNHDLFKELSENDGMFIIIEVITKA